ncbi:hypothetical protein NMG60_11033338 [Bertholletia excelsa]
MKQSISSLVPLFTLLFLLTTSQIYARSLAAKQEEEAKLNKEITTQRVPHLSEMNEDDSLDHLMGLEDCQGEEEDCVKRRMIAEAHLDYIYTQHHKP